MPKESTTDLFDLINTLSRSEKRYFKIFSTRHNIGDQNNYLKLFDEIEKQKDYNEKDIQEKFKEEKFIKQLPRIKNYLYEIILRSLDSYYSEDTADSKLKKLLHYASILHRKRLYKQCKKSLNKAKEIAYRFEKFHKVLEVLKWERKLIISKPYSKKIVKELNSLLDEEKKLMEIINNINHFSDLYYHLITQQKKGSARREDEISIYEDIIKDKLLQNEDNIKSITARIFYYYLKSSYAFAKGNFKETYNFAKKLKDIMEENPDQINEEPNKYLSALNNYITICFLTNKYDELVESFNKLSIISDDLPFNTTEDIVVKIFTHSYNLGLNTYINRGEFNKGIQIVTDIEEGLEKFEGKLGEADLLVLYYNLAYLYIGAEQYNNALTWINKVLNYPDKELREDLHSFSRILNLIIHFELGNQDLLVHAVRSTYRYLLKNKRLNKFEESILDFLKKSNKIDNNEKFRSYFEELMVEITKLSYDPFERQALDYFDFIAWLESKLNETSFADIIKKKFAEISVELLSDNINQKSD